MTTPNLITPSPLAYFGKVPCRGDFIKGSYAPELVKKLDDWISKGVGIIAKDPHWKPVFAEGEGFDFAVVGMSDRQHILAGRVQPSSDSSNRHYPFVAASSFELRSTAFHLPLSPLFLSSYWNTLDLWLKQGFSQEDGAKFARILDTFPVEQCEFEEEGETDTLKSYLHWNKISDLAKSLQLGSNIQAVERSVLSLGMLLHPLLAGTSLALEKGIRLPLPSEGKTAKKCAAFWLTMIASFFQKTKREVCIFLPKKEGENYMLVGFDSGSEDMLAALLDIRLQSDYFVSLENPLWADIENATESDYGMSKLSGYLKQPQLTLQQLLSSFNDTFAG